MGNGRTVALLEKRPESERPRRKESIQVDKAYVTCWDTIRSPKASSNTPFLVRGEELRSACLPTRVSWERASAPCAGPCWLMPGEDSHVERPDLAWPSGENACHPCQRSASGLRFSLLVPRGELPRSNGITLVPLNIRDFRF